MLKKNWGRQWLQSINAPLYAAQHNVRCLGAELGKKKKRGRLSSPSSVDPPPCLLSVPERSCSIALVWALSLPWGVWVLQHKTVNPPESWWLLIRYSHPASCPEENSSGPRSLSLIIPLSLFTVALQPAGPHAHITAYSIWCRVQPQLLASFLSICSTQQTSCLCLCLSGGVTLFPSLSDVPLTSSFSPVIFSLSLRLLPSSSPFLTCHSRPVSPGCEERRGCNCHPPRERGSVLWPRVVPDRDNVCRWDTNRALPVGGRPKLSWPGVHLNRSVTPVAKCWVSSGDEPDGVNKQTNKQTLSGVREMLLQHVQTAQTSNTDNKGRARRD